MSPDVVEAADAGLTGLRVLIVEDEVLVAFNIESEVLSAGGTVVATAHSLGEALGFVDSVVDIAILDINLAGEKVWPLARALVDRGVPIVFASANCGDATVHDAGFGAVTCLDKPVSMARLVRVAAEVARAARR